MQTKFILCQDNPEGLQCLSFIPKARANASFLFQAYREVKDFVCGLMGISRAIWGLSGNAECVDQPELCWQGLGGRSGVLKFCPGCGCHLP